VLAVWDERRVAVRDGVLVLLTLGSGGVDAVCFFGLGHVFTAVMTGNLVLFGLNAGQAEVVGLLRAAVALAGYAVAAFAASRWLPGYAVTAPWPGRATAATSAELVLQAAVVAGWIALGGHPGVGMQFVLITGYALAMGIQSAITRALAIPGVSTTYVTGTMTGVLADLALRSAGGRSIGRRVAVVASVAVGALCASVLLRFTPLLAPVFPLAVTGIAVLTAVMVFHRAPRVSD
jgi:uncharacterized membrane protein YoaK (UPF0700 family)